MQLFDRGGQLTSRPAPNPTISPGWVNNDLTQTTAPTISDPDWANAVTAECQNLLTWVGLTFSKAAVNQLLLAILRIAGGNITTITSSPGSALTPDNAGLVLVNAAAGNIAITLPAAAGAGGSAIPFRFLRSDATTHTITITAAGSDTFLLGGGTTATLPAGKLDLVSDGVSYWCAATQQEPYILLQHQEPSGTNGGTFTAGSWQQRPMTTKVQDTAGLCTLTANEFALPAGTYRARGHFQGVGVDYHQAQLWDVTDSALLLPGTSAQCTGPSTTDQVGTDSLIEGIFTLSASKTLEVRQQSTQTGTGTGFGVACGFGITEVYAGLELMKIG